MDTTQRTQQLIEANIGNLVVSMAQANAVIEALQAELAALKAPDKKK